jgi:hypothetical protein
MVAFTDVQFTDILSELFSPEAPPMSLAVAEWAMSLKLTKDQKARMLELAELASRGEITEEQRREMDSHLDAGNILTLLHAKARLSLMQQQDVN